MDCPVGALSKSTETVTTCEPPGDTVKGAGGDHEIHEPEVSRLIDVTLRSVLPSFEIVKVSVPEPPAGA